MPGAYKALIFVLIQQVYGLEILGDIASWQSIAQIVGFFTAIGWSSLILTRVARAETKASRGEAFYCLSMMAGFTLVICNICTLLIGTILDKNSDAIQISCWLTAWTLYQIPRHYFIALKAYRKALCLDIGIITLSISSIAASSAIHVSLWLALSMATGGLSAFLLIQKGTNSLLPKIGYDIKGLEFGLANFLSGGIPLSFIPLASYFEGEALAGAISLFISITAIALLIPRAISLNQLPKLAQCVDTPEKLTTHTAPMRRQVCLSNYFTSLLCLVIAILILLKFSKTLEAIYLAPILLLLTLQNTINIQGLIDSNILMAKEKSRILLKINITTSLAFFFITIAMAFSLTNHQFLYICLTSILINTYRLHQTRKFANEIHDSHTAL